MDGLPFESPHDWLTEMPTEGILTLTLNVTLTEMPTEGIWELKYVTPMLEGATAEKAGRGDCAKPALRRQIAEKALGWEFEDDWDYDRLGEAGTDQEASQEADAGAGVQEGCSQIAVSPGGVAGSGFQAVRAAKWESNEPEATSVAEGPQFTPKPPQGPSPNRLGRRSGMSEFLDDKRTGHRIQEGHHDGIRDRPGSKESSCSNRSNRSPSVGNPEVLNVSSKAEALVMAETFA